MTTKRCSPAQSHNASDCAKVGELLARVGDKWTVMVVMALGDGPQRFGEIRRTVSGISQQMLTRTLRALERDGMVLRTLYPSIPPRVEYELRPLGFSLLEPVSALGKWALEHAAATDAARAEFDERQASASSFHPTPTSSSINDTRNRTAVKIAS
jgi:DNA-binding HxlR family transcriptional regulator